MIAFFDYQLSDFLLFSPRVYERLFVLHNATLWPLPIVMVLLGLVGGWGLWVRHTAWTTAITICLGLLWIFLAVAFFWTRYATINWAASYVAPLIVLEGIGLIIAGGAGRLWFHDTSTVHHKIAVAFFLLVIVIYPLLAPASGRPFAGGEVFGLAPDPTALATLAVLAASAGQWRWPLMIVPGFWCVMSGLTQVALGLPLAWVAPVGALWLVALAVANTRRT